MCAPGRFLLNTTPVVQHQAQHNHRLVHHIHLWFYGISSTQLGLGAGARHWGLMPLRLFIHGGEALLTSVGSASMALAPSLGTPLECNSVSAVLVCVDTQHWGRACLVDT